ncbi:MAG: DUF4834 family protein [Cyclobacteriaceae bacterium]|nr:DUF4834 family protein [Cyclobacteriaceae bacterium]MCH8517637.1 DUF4834 family protein [Cyclobacteriaceae bacterium]
MFKFLLIIFLIGFIIYKSWQLLFRIFFGRLQKEYQQSANRQSENNSYRPKDGNVHIKYDPKKKSSNKNDSTDKGDYIDYEEVK